MDFKAGANPFSRLLCSSFLTMDLGVPFRALQFLHDCDDIISLANHVEQFYMKVNATSHFLAREIVNITQMNIL